jgi:hypothetical protein
MVAQLLLEPTSHSLVALAVAALALEETGTPMDHNLVLAELRVASRQTLFLTSAQR